ncbi:MAG TPA: hypothetical protein VI911_08685 [Patescibacteria group bacterium]|nr:MAG: hypothetical protein UR43_C0005G0095 [candidate division TM6 bacterium GW2011_GWF2_33_332]HLD91072.1 hypothetical protein [Patescibacteria group bacterium]
MKFYKFANGQLINVDYIKEKLAIIDIVEQSYGCNEWFFTIKFKADTGLESIQPTFDNEILAKEQLKEFIYYLETNL